MCLGPEIALAAQVIGGVTAAAGTAYSVVQGQRASAASRRAERLRKKQLRLKQQQERREQIRQFQINRSQAVSNISSATGGQGLLGANSAFGGATGALTSTLGTQLGELNQATDIGLGIFDANAQQSQASANARTGQGIAGFGADLFSSGPAIGRVGATLFGGDSNYKGI